MQIEHNQFNWSNWSQTKSNLRQKKDHSNIEEVIDEFKSDFFNDPTKSRSNSSSRSNWGSSYLPYLQRLKVIATKHNRKLNKALFIETLKSYSENSRSRQQCGSSLKAFGDYCKIELPSNWRSLAYGYGLHKAQFRQLPSDKQIEKIYEMIPNPKWKLVYGLMATYGLRNHEVFFCDLSCLKKGGDKILRVFPNTKTGEHQVWPFHPEWIEKFQLNVAIAKIHELTNLFEKNLNNQISNTILLEANIKFVKVMMPFAPHLSCECLQKLEGAAFYEKIKWPKVDQSLLNEQEVTLVVQINGKKRGLIITKKDLPEKDALAEAKKIQNIKKNLKDKKIIKNIFVKNKIINFITAQ